MHKRWCWISGVAILFVLCGLLPLFAQMTRPAAKLENSSRATVLVELFTSEGCSSCPPADALLRQIEGMQTESGQLIVGISEHVTYWNRLGWSDPYSSEVYTARQNGYGERFHLDSVYTPQMIINGSEQIVGSDKAGLLRAFQKEWQRPQIPVRILSTKIDGRSLTLSFSVGGMIPAAGAEIVVALVDDADHSSVLRGENAGRVLSHVAVARAITQVANIHAAMEKTVEVLLPSSFQSSQTGGHHLILFAQSAGLGQVIGVDTKPI